MQEQHLLKGVHGHTVALMFPFVKTWCNMQEQHLLKGMHDLTVVLISNQFDPPSRWLLGKVTVMLASARGLAHDLAIFPPRGLGPTGRCGIWRGWACRGIRPMPP